MIASPFVVVVSFFATMNYTTTCFEDSRGAKKKGGAFDKFSGGEKVGEDQ